MNNSKHHLWRALRPFTAQLALPLKPSKGEANRWICSNCLSSRQQPLLKRTSHRSRPNQHNSRRNQSTNNPADSPGFTSIVDNPPVLVRAGRRHKPFGVLILAAIPVTAFLLGCWQVQRLGWKTDLIARFEDRLIRDPLPLPPIVDPAAVNEFDYRRIYARGVLRHDQEMLIGPRLHDGTDGYLVITPLERSGDFPGVKGNTTVLVCRGWISKSKADQASRPLGLPQGEIMVEGLLREPWKRNMFTPKNDPEKENWYFPDVYEMAQHVGSQAIWVEETMRPDLLVAYDRESKGIPIGRPPEVNLRNNHAQYIFTWFSLSAATSIMLWMVLKRPAGRRIRKNIRWS